ncbi:MAG: ABC transporter substrate-binding protein, partial [Pseudomonadota bacterium]|nr:ABC transporter substrate-binding protein [Pseudomonadota bacterium]
MFTRRSTLTALLTGVLILVVVPGAIVSAAAKSPQEIVQDTSDKVLKIINNRGKELEKDAEARIKLINKILMPAIDFQAFSQLVLGVNWRTATPEQRKRFMQTFKHMLVRTYTK